MKTIAIPEPRSLRITPKSCSVSCASRLDVGSSRIRIRADEISSARAMAAICWIATEYEPRGCVTSTSTSRPPEDLVGPSVQGAPVDPPQRFGARPIRMFSPTDRFGQRLTSW